MRTLTTCLVAAALLAAAANPCIADEAKPSPAYEKVKFLEPLVGSWKLTEVVNGQPIALELECRWLAGKSGLSWVAHERPRPGGPRQEFASGIILYDGQGGAAKEYTAFGNGDTRVAVLKPLGDHRISWACTVVGADGTTSTVDFQATLGPDRIAFTDCDRKGKDGKVVETARNGSMTRVAAGAAPGRAVTGAEPTPTASYEDFLEFGRRMEGRWVGQVKLIHDWPGHDKRKGDVITSNSTVRWVADKRGLEEVSLGGGSEGRSLHFWDAAARQIKIVTTNSGGHTWVVNVGRQGDRWPWTLKGSLKDGAVFEGIGVVVFPGDGKYVIEGKCTIGGKPTDPLHDVYTKVSK